MRDYKPGTNGLEAFDACVECGACSEEKFFESDEYNNFKSGQIGHIIGSVIGGVALLGGLIACCCCKKSEDVPTTGTVVTSPEPVQPVAQPTTTVIINNNNNNSGFQQPQQPQFQPQQQVKYQFQFSDCTQGSEGIGRPRDELRRGPSLGPLIVLFNFESKFI